MWGLHRLDGSGLGQRQVSVCCEHGGFYKTWRIFWLAEEQSVFQWFCTMELVRLQTVKFVALTSFECYFLSWRCTTANLNQYKQYIKHEIFCCLIRTVSHARPAKQSISIKEEMWTTCQTVCIYWRSLCSTSVL